MIRIHRCYRGHTFLLQFNRQTRTATQFIVWDWWELRLLTWSEAEELCDTIDQLVKLDKATK